MLVYRVRWLPKNLPGKWGDNREYEKCSLAHCFKFVPRCTSVSRALYATRSGRLSGRLQIYLDKFDSCALLQWETPSLYSQTVRVVRLLRRVEKQHFHSFFIDKRKIMWYNIYRNKKEKRYTNGTSNYKRTNL